MKCQKMVFEVKVKLESKSPTIVPGFETQIQHEVLFNGDNLQHCVQRKSSAEYKWIWREWKKFQEDQTFGKKLLGGCDLQIR